MEEQENKKGKVNVILVVIIVFLLGLNGYLGYDKFFNNKKESVPENKEPVSSDDVPENKEPVSFEGLKIYGRKEKNYDGNINTYICKEQSKDCNEVITTIKASADDAEVLQVGDYESSYNESTSSVLLGDGNAYVIYYDNGINYYDFKTKNVVNLEVGAPKDKIKEYIESKNLVYNCKKDSCLYSYVEPYYHGDTEHKEENYYYNLKTGKKLFSDYNRLSRLNIDNSDETSERYFTGIKNGKLYLLDTETEKVIVDRKNGSNPMEIASFKGIKSCSDGGMSLFVSYLTEEASLPYSYILYDKTGKIISEFAKDEIYISDYCQNGADITVYKKDRVYNENGTLK